MLHRPAPRINELCQVAVAESRHAEFASLLGLDADTGETCYRVKAELFQSFRDVASQFGQRLCGVLVARRETRVESLCLLFPSRPRRLRVTRLERHIAILTHAIAFCIDLRQPPSQWNQAGPYHNLRIQRVAAL